MINLSVCYVILFHPLVTFGTFGFSVQFVTPKMLVRSCERYRY
jgi:hypothetical protein